MPLHMRMPKRGFNNIFANDFAEVNLGRLQKAIDDKQLDACRQDHRRSAAEGRPGPQEPRRRAPARQGRDQGQDRYRSGRRLGVGAREAVEKAGGTVTTTFKKKVYMNKKGEPGKRQQRRAKAAEKRAARNGIGYNGLPARRRAGRPDIKSA